MADSSRSLASVSPRDCALVITVPLTRDEFLGDLAAPGRKHFASHVVASNAVRGASEDYYWNSVYGPVARTTTRVAARAEKLGVTVRRGARIADLTDLLSAFPVVTLIAHWRFARFAPDDIVDVAGFLDALGRAEGRVPRALRREVTALRPDLGADERSGNGSEVSREELATILNQVVAKTHALYSRREAGGETAPAPDDERTGHPLDRLTRVAVERAFPCHLAPARAVEFADGLRTVPEVVDAVPTDFDGVLDLTVCNSVILGEAIKRERPRCLVPVNRYPAGLAARMTLYSLAVSELARRPAPYIDVLARIHKR
jgi:hypothetical protein